MTYPSPRNCCYTERQLPLLVNRTYRTWYCSWSYPNTLSHSWSWRECCVFAGNLVLLAMLNVVWWNRCQTLWCIGWRSVSVLDPSPVSVLGVCVLFLDTVIGISSLNYVTGYSELRQDYQTQTRNKVFGYDQLQYHVRYVLFTNSGSCLSV